MTHIFQPRSIPHAPRGLSYHDVCNDRWIIIDPMRPSWAIMDSLGKEIIQESNGERTLEEITKLICDRHGGDAERSLPAVTQFANTLLDDEVLFPQPVSETEGLEYRAKPSGNEGTLWLNITDRCNLRCIHCFRDSGSKLIPEISASEIFAVITQFRELGGTELVISGGEPLLREDALDILTFAAPRIPNLKLITNATQITSEIAQEIVRIKLPFIQVSLDGASRETSAKVRGFGAYDSALQGVAHLQDAGYKGDLVFSMVLLRHTHHEIPEFAEMAISHGATGVHYPLFQSIGRGALGDDDLSLSSEEMYKAVRQVLDERRRLSTKVTFAMSPEIIADCRGRRRNYCGAGINVWSMNANGDITPCAGLCDDQFIAGNIRSQSLQEICESSAVRRMFEQLHVVDHPQCRECEFIFMCGGGCHVDRYHATGDLLGEWPRCDVARRIHLDYIVAVAETRAESTTETQ